MSNERENSFKDDHLKSYSDLLVLLIQEDLKSRKFFDGLRELGLDDAYYQPELAPIILTMVGLDPELDKANDFYYHLAESYVHQVTTDRQQVYTLATKVMEKLAKR